MKKWLFILFFAFLGAPSSAQPFCGLLEKIDERLTKTHGETKIWSGAVYGTDSIEIHLYLNDSSGDWTLIRTDGFRACLLDAGNDATRILHGIEL